MARREQDSWNPGTGVGATATMAAAARAVAARAPHPVVVDPYAESLVRAVGIDFFTRLVDGSLDTPDLNRAAHATTAHRRNGRTDTVLR